MSLLGYILCPLEQATSDPALIALATFKNLEVGKHYTFATDHLKGLRLWSKAVPTLQPAATLAALQPHSSMMAEFGRAKAQHLLYQKYQEFPGSIKWCVGLLEHWDFIFAVLAKAGRL